MISSIQTVLSPCECLLSITLCMVRKCLTVNQINCSGLRLCSAQKGHKVCETHFEQNHEFQYKFFTTWKQCAGGSPYSQNKLKKKSFEKLLFYTSKNNTPFNSCGGYKHIACVSLKGGQQYLKTLRTLFYE